MSRDRRLRLRRGDGARNTRESVARLLHDRRWRIESLQGTLLPGTDCLPRHLIHNLLNVNNPVTISLFSFQIHEIVDKHWCLGQSQDRVGKFPSSHLHKVEVPEFSETERLFVAVAGFPGQETDDLSFAQGRFITEHIV